MADYEISATVISRLFEAEPPDYEKVYNTFKNKKFIPKIYSNLNTVIRMINDGHPDKDINLQIETGYYIKTPNVDWKNKTIKLVDLYKDTISENTSLNNLINYKGENLNINFKYDKSKDDYEKEINIHLKPSFYNEYKNNKYLYYLVPSKNKWTEGNLKCLYVLLNEALKSDKYFSDYKEIKIIHLPEKTILKNIPTTKILKKTRDIVKLFSIYVLDRATVDKVGDMEALVSEFNGDDDFDF